MGEWKTKQVREDPSMKALVIGGIILWALVMAALVVWYLTRWHHL